MNENRREIIGIVVSDKADKTITVKVETYKKDPLYGKRVKYSKKYTAHDENNIAKVGDKVRLVGCNSIISLVGRRKNYGTTRNSFKSSG